MRHLISSLSIALLLGVLAVGCGGKKGGPGKVGLPAIATHLNGIASLLETHGDDVAAAEKAVEGYMAEHQAEIEAIQENARAETAELSAGMEELTNSADAMKKLPAMLKKMGLTKAVMADLQQAGQRIEKALADHPDLAQSKKLSSMTAGMKQMSRGISQLGVMLGD